MGARATTRLAYSYLPNPNPRHCHHFHTVELYPLTLQLRLPFPQANHLLCFPISRVVSGIDAQTQPGVGRISALVVIHEQLLDSDSGYLDQGTGELDDEYQLTTLC